jgi:hypothetical protein
MWETLSNAYIQVCDYLFGQTITEWLSEMTGVAEDVLHTQMLGGFIGYSLAATMVLVVLAVKLARMRKCARLSSIL